jgi:phage portal protein BeeE
MALFGLVTKKDYQTLQKELETVKLEYEKLPRWLLEAAGAEKYTLPDPSLYETQSNLYRKLSWIAKCIDAFGNALPGAKFNVKRLVGEKTKDIPNHPFEQLLRIPNPMQSRSEFLYSVGAEYKLTGNVYIWLNSKDEYNPPSEMWVIPSHMIQPIPDEKMFIRGYYYYPGDGQEMILEPHEIIHLKRFNPFSRFVGLSAAEAIAVTAAGGQGMKDWNTRLFAENNARLPGILLFEQFVEQGMWDKIKGDTREAAKKRELLMLRGTGQGGVRWLQNSISQREMEFLEGLEAGEKDVMDTLTPGLYTWLSQSSTMANSESNRAAFNELTLYTFHTLLAEKITAQILPRYAGRPLVGEFDDVRISDRAMKLQEQAAYERSHNIAEVREKFYDDQPLGDERDDLMIAQIKPENSAPAQPAPLQPAENPAEVPQAPTGEADEMTEKPPENSAVLADLARYERKAMKRIGRPVNFESDHIPADTLRTLAARLTACDSAEAVKMVFSTTREKLRPATPADIATRLDILIGKIK